MSKKKGEIMSQSPINSIPAGPFSFPAEPAFCVPEETDRVENLSAFSHHNLLYFFIGGLCFTMVIFGTIKTYENFGGRGIWVGPQGDHDDDDDEGATEKEDKNEYLKNEINKLSDVVYRMNSNFDRLNSSDKIQTNRYLKISNQISGFENILEGVDKRLDTVEELGNRLEVVEHKLFPSRKAKGRKTVHTLGPGTQP